MQVKFMIKNILAVLVHFYFKMPDLVIFTKLGECNYKPHKIVLANYIKHKK
jgi:hypothetical protein